MKVRRPGTDIEAEFCVFCDDKRCEELTLIGRPVDNNAEAVTKECYVSVEANKRITVVGHFSGEVLHARFDYIADGSYLGCRHVEAEKYGGTKVHKGRRIDFKTISSLFRIEDGSALAKTQTNAKTAKSGNDAVVDATLECRVLPSNISTDRVMADGQALGVGSLVIIIWLENVKSAGIVPSMMDYNNQKLGHWMMSSLTAQNSGIFPTHLVALVDVNAGIVKQKANKYLQSMDQPRYGQAPFAKLIFHYRSREALLQAGCMPHPARPYPVPAQFVALPPIDSSPEPEQSQQARATLRSPAHISDHFTSATNRTSWEDVVELDSPPRIADSVSHNSLLQSRFSTPRLHADAIPPSEAESRLISAPARIHIEGQDFTLPSAAEVLSFVPEEGIRLSILLKIFFPQLSDNSRSAVANALAQHIKPHAGFRRDSTGAQFCYSQRVLERSNRNSVALGNDQTPVIEDHTDRKRGLSSTSTPDRSKPFDDSDLLSACQHRDRRPEAPQMTIEEQQDQLTALQMQLGNTPGQDKSDLSFS